MLKWHPKYCKIFDTCNIPFFCKDPWFPIYPLPLVFNPRVSNLGHVLSYSESSMLLHNLMLLWNDQPIAYFTVEMDSEFVVVYVCISHLLWYKATSGIMKCIHIITYDCCMFLKVFLQNDRGRNRLLVSLIWTLHHFNNSLVTITNTTKILKRYNS